MKITKNKNGKIAESKIISNYSDHYCIVKTLRLNKEIITEFSIYKKINDKENQLLIPGKFNYIVHKQARLTNDNLIELHNQAINSNLVEF